MEESRVKTFSETLSCWMAKFALISSNPCYLSFYVKNLYECIGKCIEKCIGVSSYSAKSISYQHSQRENLCSEELRYSYCLCHSVPCPTGHWDQGSLSCLPWADNTFSKALLGALPLHGHFQPPLSFAFPSSIHPCTHRPGVCLPPGQPVPPPASLHVLLLFDLLSQGGPCSSTLTSCQVLLDSLRIRLASTWAWRTLSLKIQEGLKAPFGLQDSPSRSSAN